MARYKALTVIILGGKTILEGEEFEYDGETHGTPDHNMELVPEIVKPKAVKTQKPEPTES